MTVRKVRVSRAVCRPDFAPANSAQTVWTQPEKSSSKRQQSRSIHRTLTPSGPPCRVVRVEICSHRFLLWIAAGEEGVVFGRFDRKAECNNHCTGDLRAGQTLVRKSCRKLTSGICLWQLLTFLICTAGVASLVFVVGLRVSRADEKRGWMIPRRALLGLAGERSLPSGRSEKTPSSAQWMAEVPETAWEFILIHHSATQAGSVQVIHEDHRQRKDAAGNSWLGIGYHFVIGNGNGMLDGAIEPTFRWNEQLHGAHSGNAMFNSRGIGICLIGDFEKTPPSRAQMESVRELVRVLATRHGITRANLMGHEAVKATACPGKYFPLKELRMVLPESRS